MSKRAVRMRRLLWGLAKTLVIATVIATGVWWFRFSPVDVDVQRATTGTVVAEVLGTGTLETRIHAAIGPRITGRLTSVLVDQGDRVEAGQVVATLHDGDLQLKVAVARAGVAVTRAAVDRAAGAVVRAEANAVLARSSFERTQQLVELRAASVDELDRARQQRDVAEADLTLAALAKTESERLVTLAQQSLRYDEERLADTRISAPFDALVVRRDREPGEVVVPGSTILEIASTDELWVSAWVDETALDELAVGQRARIEFRSEPATAITGRVVRLAPRTDAETREFLVDVALDELPAIWALSQRAEVYIESGRRENVVILPQRLVSWRGGVPGVLLDDAGAARWAPVALGLRGREFVEVTEGLSDRQIVIDIADGAQAPREGRQVRYVRP